MPDAAAFADVYDELLELAEEHLTRPVTATVRTYEDGTIRILVYHHRPAQQEREVLYYHTERSDGAVEYAIEDRANEELRAERTIAEIEPPAGSTL